MQVKSIAEFCNAFDQLSLTPLFCLFLSSRFTHVLLYYTLYQKKNNAEN